MPQNWVYQESLYDDLNTPEVDESEIGYSDGPLPDSGDYVYFQGNPLLPYSEESFPTYYDCNGFGLASGVFELVSIGSVGNGSVYNKTVTLATGFETDNYFQASGKLSQPASGTDVTVYEVFTWVGGELNSSSHLSDVFIRGANALIAPTSSGIVTAGSNLVFTDDTEGTIQNGTIQLRNESIVTVDNGAAVYVEAFAEDSVILTPDDFFARMTISVGLFSSFTVVHGGLLNRGAVRTMGYCTLNPGTLFHCQPNFLFGPLSAYSQVGMNSITALADGSELRAFGDVSIENGKLSTIAYSESEEHEATIKCVTLKVSGGEIVLGDGSIPHIFSELWVMGDVIWTGGTYRPVVDGSRNGGAADCWYTDGTFSVGGSTVIAPGSIDYEGECTPYESNWLWEIIHADAGITVQAGSAPPTVTGYFQLYFEPDDTVFSWKIKSVIN